MDEKKFNEDYPTLKAKQGRQRELLKLIGDLKTRIEKDKRYLDRLEYMHYVSQISIHNQTNENTFV